MYHKILHILSNQKSKLQIPFFVFSGSMNSRILLCENKKVRFFFRGYIAKMVPRAGARIHFLLAKWHTFYFLIHGRHTPVGSEQQQQRFKPTACRHAAQGGT